MEATVLYDLIKQAKAENKAVQLYPNNDNELEIIIEPEHEVMNEPGNTLRVPDGLVDLKLIVAAQIVPNRKDRLNEFRRLEPVTETHS